MKRSSFAGFFGRLSKATPSEGRLLEVQWELTRRCNLRCKHCYLPVPKRSGTPPGISLSSVKRIADELQRAGCLFTILTGGEVFVRPDITSILEYLWSKGFIITIATNGALIDERMARFLSKAASPTYLRVTLYGFTDATMKDVTGVASVLDKTLAAIELLKRYKVAFALDAFVTKKNLKELDRIRELARKLEVLFQYQYLINPRLDGSRDVLHHQIAAKDLAKLLRYEREGAQSGAACGEHTVSRTNPFYCSAGRTSMAIDAFGKASACVNLPLPGADILRGGVEAGWRRVVEYVGGAAATDTYHCHECALYQSCTWCPAMGWLYKKDINACVPFYKREAEIEKMAYHG
jgi:MoaA/NifB/PqqE/SkfB family radical SAM enzyme